MPQFSKRSIDNLKGVHPRLVEVLTAAILTSPVDFTITEGVRTKERQKELYAQGRSVKGMKVTNADGITRKSNHQAKADGFGHAVDLYPFIDGKVRVNESYVVDKLRTIATHIKLVAAVHNVPITWGGDWKTPFDPPHFELK